MKFKTTLLLLVLTAGSANAQNWGLPELPGIGGSYDYGITPYTPPAVEWPSFSQPTYQNDLSAVQRIEEQRLRVIDAQNRANQPPSQFELCSRPAGVMSSYYRRCMRHY